MSSSHPTQGRNIQVNQLHRTLEIMHIKQKKKKNTPHLAIYNKETPQNILINDDTNA